MKRTMSKSEQTADMQDYNWISRLLNELFTNHRPGIGYYAILTSYTGGKATSSKRAAAANSPERRSQTSFVSE